jgi:hypothetical protein
MPKLMKTGGGCPPPPNGNSGSFPLNKDLSFWDCEEITTDAKTGEALKYPRYKIILKDREGREYTGTISAFYCSYVSEQGTFEYDATHYTDPRLDEWFQYQEDPAVQVRQIIGKAIELTPERSEHTLDRSRYMQLAANGKWYPFARKSKIKIVKVATTQTA